jgi:hypothetical protein
MARAAIASLTAPATQTRSPGGWSEADIAPFLGKWKKRKGFSCAAGMDVSLSGSVLTVVYSALLGGGTYTYPIQTADKTRIVMLYGKRPWMLNMVGQDQVDLVTPEATCYFARAPR